MAPTYLSPGVYVEEVDGGSKPIELAGTAVAAFAGFAQKGPANTPTLVTNWTQYVQQFGDFMENSYLAHAVYGYFNNGGGRCYIVRVGATDDGDSADTATAVAAPAGATAALPSRSGTPVDTIQVTATESGAGSDITVEISDPAATEGEEQAGDDLFNVTIRRGTQEEVFENLTLRRVADSRNVETVLNDPDTGSKLVQVTILRTSGAMPERRPSVGTYSLTMAAAPPVPISGEVLSISPMDFEGSAPARTGIGALQAADDVTMLLAPDLMMAYQKGMIDLEGVQAVQTAMITHCESMGDRVAILDAPPGMKPQEIRDWRVNIANYDTSYAALYYPWVRVFDPVAGKSMLVPPSGHVAGIWARSDATRGVHKAPANEVVGGALDVEFQITKGEQDILNPRGINCIRAFPGRGIRVWGARTLSSDPAWRYLNVRRLFNMVEKSIESGTQWVVFEPNDFALWQRIKRTANGFLTMVWRSGALFGATPAQAFFVKCDEETNPPEARDLGMVTIEIGIAPVKPAEFVIFRISQWTPEA
ncbi:MAG: phage tail sheath family protein [Chloroflexi bacterium]|nr:phage tail sheath family protein [Chloroflexota bacterium]